MLATKQPWSSYLKYGKRIFFKRNSVVFKQGDIGGGFYYIHKGIVKIISANPGKSIRILDVTGPGYLHGEIDYLPYYSSAVCHEDCIIYYFSKDDYDILIRKHPEVTILYAQSLIRKEKLLLNNINITRTGTEYQVACSLLYLMNSYQSTEIDLTQQELAHYVGMTRITVYKILKKWASEEILLAKNRKIFIMDIEALKQKLLI